MGTHYRKLVVVLFCLSLQIHASVEDLVLNEVLADPNPSVSGDTAGFIDDYEGKQRFVHSGWVEIYNGGAESVNLKGLHLTDNCLVPDKWEIPGNPPPPPFPQLNEVTDGDWYIEPGAYRVVYCPRMFRGEYNCGTEARPLDCPVPIPADKAPFELEKSGGWIGLYDATGGVLLSRFDHRETPVGMSFGYGIFPEGIQEAALCFLQEPTPGEPNSEGLRIPPEIQMRSYRGVKDVGGTRSSACGLREGTRRGYVCR